LGYSRGFDVFVRLYQAGGFDIWTRTDPDFVLQTFTEQLDQASNQPLFIYLHLVYPHRPYMPAAPYADMFGPGFERMIPRERQGMINRYDGEIRQTDDLLGAMVEHLEERKLIAETAIFFTSDHGEGFWEHGLSEHGKSFFDEEIKIPLIFLPPGGRTSEPPQVATPISNIDLFPTILDLAGIPPAKEIEGESLLRHFHGEKINETGRWLFSESPHS
jgi:arylsulfatase A-like enzyme